MLASLREKLFYGNIHVLCAMGADEGLPTKQIKEVIQSQKIHGPDHLVAEIIHQSQGKPGLAVTLCRLCWESGSGRDVMLGTALARDVKLSFEPLLGQPATNLLECFSVGGDAGMSLEAVARLLGKNALEVRRTVEQLSAAGVLDVSRENRISVHPFRLRQALVRDVFLKPPVVDLTPYLSEVTDYAAATRVLIEAKLMGGILPDEMLRERLQQIAGTREELAFEEYAHLGWHEAEWVLDHYPKKLKSVALGALNNCPEKILGILLDAAAAAYEERSLQRWSTRTEDVMPEIKSWILGAKPNDDEATERRKLLGDSLEKWFAANKNLFVGVQAAELVLSIKHEATSNSPGEPMTMIFHSGVVAQSQLHRIASLWSKVLPILREADPSQESSVANIFHEWIHPNFHGRNTPKEYENESHSLAKQMMTELLAAFEGNWTMHHHLHNYAEKLGLLAKVKIDPIAEILYPPRDFLDWEKENARRSAAADELASQLKDKDPVSVANLLTPIEQQARAANISYPSWGRHVCWRIRGDLWTTDPRTLYDLVLEILRRDNEPIRRETLLRVTNKKKISGLEQTISEGQVEILRELARWKPGRGEEINMSTERIWDQTPLYYAVNCLFHFRASPYEAARQTRRLMPESVAQKLRLETLEALHSMLAKDFNPDGVLKCIDCLVNELHVDLDTPNRDDNTALTCAAEARLRDVAALLLAAGASVNHRFRGGGTALVRAIINDDCEMAKLLLEYCADYRLFVDALGRPIYTMEMSEKMRRLIPDRV